MVIIVLGSGLSPVRHQANTWIDEIISNEN